jgi:hypothetical protein
VARIQQYKLIYKEGIKNKFEALLFHAKEKLYMVSVQLLASHREPFGNNSNVNRKLLYRIEAY